MPVECVCKYCNKIFYKAPCRIKNGRGKYCSKKCQGLDRRGKHLPWRSNWKGGISTGYYQKRINKHSCKYCNDKNNLRIHHKNKNGIDNRIDNLEVVCESCHSKIHNRYLNFKKVKYMIQMGTKVKIKSTNEIGRVDCLIGNEYVITIGKKVKRINKNDLEEI